MSIGARRLQREATGLAKRPPEYIRARPRPGNLFEFHYVLTGPPDTPYAGGQYWGVLKFPSDYPMKPPAIMMYTPSGRFQPNTRLCLSISDYHPETWNPMWSTAKVLLGLLSFMSTNEGTVGSVSSSKSKKRQLARESRAYNCRHRLFRTVFPELAEAFDKGLPDPPSAATAAELAAQTGGSAPAASGGGSGAGPAAKAAAPVAACPATPAAKAEARAAAAGAGNHTQGAGSVSPRDRSGEGDHLVQQRPAAAATGAAAAEARPAADDGTAATAPPADCSEWMRRRVVGPLLDDPRVGLAALVLVLVLLVLVLSRASGVDDDTTE